MTIPPHIPLENDAAREMLRTDRSRLIFTTITIVVAALSGFIASLVYTAYGPSTAPITSIQTRVEKTAVEAIDESRIKNTQEAIATFTGEKTDQTLAYGVALTGDGWFLASAAATKTKHALLHPQTTGAIENVVNDPASGLVFVKTNIQNARLLASGTLENTPRGSTLFIILPHTAIPVTLQDTHVCITDRCPAEYGDKISYAAGIVESLPQFMIDGAPVISGQGDLVGIATRAANNSAIIMPLTEVRSVFASVFSKGVATRVVAPLRVVNLTRWSVFDADNHLPEQGMLVESAPAATLLKEGDVITAIEHQRIEADTMLFDLVNQLQSRGAVSMTVLRTGVSMDIAVPLR